MLKKNQALKALEEGRTLVGKKNSSYPGKEVEYRPSDLNVPDFYAWHVVGQPDWDRMPVTQLEIKE